MKTPPYEKLIDMLEEIHHKEIIFYNLYECWEEEEPIFLLYDELNALWECFRKEVDVNFFNMIEKDN